jgi:hypothetical protein
MRSNDRELAVGRLPPMRIGPRSIDGSGRLRFRIEFELLFGARHSLARLFSRCHFSSSPIGDCTQAVSNLLRVEDELSRYVGIVQ